MITKTVTITASGSGIGNIKNDDGNWDVCRADANGDSTNVTRLYVRSQRANGNYQIYRSLLPIDTSPIPSYAFITSAKLTFYCLEKENNIGSGSVYLTAPTTQASTSSVSTADYNDIGSTIVGQVSISSLVVGSTNDVEISSPRSVIQKGAGAITKFGLREYYDIANSFPPSENVNAVSFDLLPVLTVVYYVFGSMMG